MYQLVDLSMFLTIGYIDSKMKDLQLWYLFYKRNGFFSIIPQSPSLIEDTPFTDKQTT